MLYILYFLQGPSLLCNKPSNLAIGLVILLIHGQVLSLHPDGNERADKDVPPVTPLSQVLTVLKESQGNKTLYLQDKRLGGFAVWHSAMTKSFSSV